MSTPVSTATVVSTSTPVRISFRRNCILASFQNRSFRAAAQELRDDRVAGPSEFIGRADFKDLAFIKHGHLRADAKSAIHLMGDNNRGYFRLLGQADN